MTAGIDDYVEYALDVPMYFIIRDGEYVEMTDQTFRQYLEQGHGGARATLDEHRDRLSTANAEARDSALSFARLHRI